MGHLGEGRQAVGGARGVGDDHVGMFVLVRVDPHDVSGDVVTFRVQGSRVRV